MGGELVLEGFDIDPKQLLFANKLSQGYGCLNYQGNFTIADRVKDNLDPRLSNNMETVYSL